VVFTVAPITSDPGRLATGRLSPVTMDSSHLRALADQHQVARLHLRGRYLEMQDLLAAH
jgi:hypothetical protein